MSSGRSFFLSIIKKYFKSFPGKSGGQAERSTPRNNLPGSSRRIAFRTFSKASMTVEAALALPLFLFTVFSLICMMEIYSSFSVSTVSLQEQVEQEGQVMATLSKNVSEISELPVRKQETICVDLPLLPFHTGTLHATVRAEVYPWTGRKTESDSGTAGTKGKLYYVSDYQSVYHTSSACSYLSLSITAVSASSLGTAKNDSGHTYTACDKCVGHGVTGTVVYITEDGEHYHNSAQCSGLSRSIHLVTEDEIAGLHQCSRCRKMEQGS